MKIVDKNWKIDGNNIEMTYVIESDEGYKFPPQTTTFIPPLGSWQPGWYTIFIDNIYPFIEGISCKMEMGIQGEGEILGWVYQQSGSPPLVLDYTESLPILSSVLFIDGGIGGLPNNRVRTYNNNAVYILGGPSWSNIKTALPPNHYLLIEWDGFMDDIQVPSPWTVIHPADTNKKILLFARNKNFSSLLQDFLTEPFVFSVLNTGGDWWITKTLTFPQITKDLIETLVY